MGKDRQVIPGPPEGFEEVEDTVMAGELPPPPKGFTDPDEAPQLPPPPEGFADTQEKGVPQKVADFLLNNQLTSDERSFYDPAKILATGVGSIASGVTGVVRSGESMKQTSEVLAGDESAIPLNRESDYQQMFGWEDLNLFKAAPKITYMIGESAPSIMAGVVGEVGGPWTASAASGGAAAFQQYGPVYADMRAQGKSDAEARRIAKVSSTITAAYAAGSYGLLRKMPGENSATNLAIQLVAGGPVASSAEMATQNVLAFERPWYEDTASAGVAGLVTGGAMMGASHLAARGRGYSKDKTKPIDDADAADLGAEDGPPKPPPIPDPPPGFRESPPPIPPKEGGELREVVPEIEGPRLQIERNKGFDPVDAPVDQKLIDIPEFILDRIKARMKGNMEEPTSIPKDDLTTGLGDTVPAERGYSNDTRDPSRKGGAGYFVAEVASKTAANDPDAYSGAVRGQQQPKTKKPPVPWNEIETEGNVTSFPGAGLPKFPKGPIEKMADLTEADASARMVDKVEGMSFRNDPLNAAKLNSSIAELKQKWDARIAERKNDAARQDLVYGAAQKLPNGFTRIMNPTDFESYTALQGNLARPDRAQWVDPNTLDVRNVMAEHTDIPEDANDPRIFMRGNMDHAQLQQTLTLHAIDGGDMHYQRLVDAGVRIAPSRGSSYVYLGEAAGKPLPYPSLSTRSNHIISGNRVGNSVYQPYTSMRGGKSFDLSKIDVDEYFATIDPTKMPTKELAKAALWKDADTTKMIIEAHRQGKLPKLERNANGQIIDERVLQVKELPRSALVSPYAGAEMAKRIPVNVPSHIKLERARGELTIVQVDDAPSLDAINMGVKLQEAITKVAPAFDNVFKRFGAKSGFDYEIRVTDVVDSPAIEWWHNKIIMPTGWFRPNSMGFFSSVEAQVISVIMHETGHAFNYRTWANLPGITRASADAAYYRELARQGQIEDYASYGSTFDPAKPLGDGSSAYHLSHTEWHAEQFRRFLSADRRFNEDLAKFYGKGADAMRDLYEAFRKIEGDYKVKQRFTPSYEFQKVTDYVESAARMGHGVIDMKIISDMARYEWMYDPPDHTHIGDVLRAVEEQVQDLAHIFTKDSRLSLDTEIPSRPHGNLASHQAGNIRLMVGVLAWLNGAQQKAVHVRRLLIHEAFHGIRRVLSDGQVELLANEAMRLKLWTEKDTARYTAHITNEMNRNYSHLDKYEREVHLRNKLNEEKAAFYMEGVRTETIGQPVPIAQKIKDFFTRLANFLKMQGFNTHEDLVRSFFRGELTRRYNQRIKSGQKRGNPFDYKVVDKDSVPKDLGDGFYGNVKHDEATGRTNYGMVGRDGKPVGYLLIEHKADGPYVDMIEIGDVGAMRRMVREGKGRLSDRLINWAEEHMGVKIRSPQEYTRAGYKMALKRDPALVFGYTEINGLYMSPKYVRDHYYKTLEVLAEAKADKWDAASLRFAESSVRTWKARFDRIPPEVFGDMRLEKQWAMREFELALWEKQRQIDAGDMKEQLTGERGPKNAFAEIKAKADAIEQKFNAEKTGYMYGAEPQIEMKAMRDVFRRSKLSPKAAAQVSGMIAHGDKMAKSYKTWFSMRQLAWMNPDVHWLRDYISIREQQNQRRMYHVAKADDNVHTWEKLHPKQADNLSKLLFWATEMKYRSALEVQNNVVRHPTRNEIIAQARRLGLGAEAVKVYDKILAHPKEFLNDIERVTAENYTRLYKNNPQGLQNALNKLTADMNRMHMRPYFPMSRFGNYALVVKDAAGKTLHFETFETQKSRDQALPAARQKFPQDKIHADIIPEEVRSFIGIPKPLLDQMLNDLTLNLSAVQRAWMQDYTNKMSPETSFRKRWLEREGTPGYSMDGMRAYADYFRRGSGYLSRLEFRDALSENRSNAVKDIDRLGFKDARRMMLEMMDSHAEWMDKPGKDFVKLKTFITNFYLGGSVAAAVTNLSQPLVFTMPYLGSLFGYAKTNAKMMRGLDAAKRTWNHLDPKLGKDFLEAHAEMVQQGHIETGQAAELGVYADSNNLDKSLVGSNAQKFWRKATYANMYMFGKTERFNRELTFRTAFELAMEDPYNKHVTDVGKWYAKEILDLQARRPNMSDEAATAFYVAREAIQRSQFTYDSWDRPKFMRSGFANSLAVFMSYPHQVLFSFRNNPGAAMSIALTLGLAGTAGFPFAEDLDNALQLVMRKFFKKDFSYKRWQKDRVEELFKGTEYEHIAPDLLVHGISKFGYGLGLMPEGYGIPRFDASASHSMGQMIPGVSTMLEKMAEGNMTDPNYMKNVIADTVKDAGGAGYGPFFAWMQLMQEQPGTDEWKKWEGALPRSMKAMSKSVRYAYNEQETNRSGAGVVKFDMRNPDDKATVIAQFLGFTPKKITEHYDTQNEFYERKNFYEARQKNFIMDYKSAMDSGNKEAMADILRNIEKYNQELKTQGLESLQIGKATIERSLSARARAKARTEGGFAQQNKYQQLWDQVRGPKAIDEKVPKGD